MRLELGSGDNPTEGFVHLDIRADAPGVDIVGDVENLEAAGVDFGSCEEIRATHLLEHISHRQTVEVLKHWRSFLKPGGHLYIEVPNLGGHIARWRMGDAKSDEEVITYLFGEQDHEFNYHKTMFTGTTLRNALNDAGFTVLHLEDIGLVLCAEAMR